MYGNKPQGWRKALTYAADLMRIAAVLSAAAAWFWFGLSGAALFGLVFVALLIPRLVRVPGPFDFAFGATLLLATWSNVLGWYRAIWWWDLVVHWIAPAAIAAMIYLVLAKLGIVQDMHGATVKHNRSSLVILTTSFGLTAAALWEFAEWMIENLTRVRIHVGYDDTIADLAAGGVGAFMAGFVLVLWAECGRRNQRTSR